MCWRPKMRRNKCWFGSSESVVYAQASWLEMVPGRLLDVLLLLPCFCFWGQGPQGLWGDAKVQDRQQKDGLEWEE